MAEIEFPLIGPSGEPVDFARTINGHGVTSLPPLQVDETENTLRATLGLDGVRPRMVTVRSPKRDLGVIMVHGTSPDEAERGLILNAVRHTLRLDQDLTPFYRLAEADPELSWVTSGAGRMTRCQTVFEDVVKTVCTTNCAWSATVRMVNALVQHLGEHADGAPNESWEGRAFPSAARMAMAEETFFRETVRCGYRSAYLRTLAQLVVDGEVDLEMLGQESEEAVPDDELAQRLLALPGVGPYAAAHIMMMLGRYSRLIFDSWTRPAYAKLAGREVIEDAEIQERFAPYGRYAGLAFWLAITKDWIASD